MSYQHHLVDLGGDVKQEVICCKPPHIASESEVNEELRVGRKYHTPFPGEKQSICDLLSKYLLYDIYISVQIIIFLYLPMCKVSSDLPKSFH